MNQKPTGIKRSRMSILLARSEIARVRRAAKKSKLSLSRFVAGAIAMALPLPSKAPAGYAATKHGQHNAV